VSKTGVRERRLSEPDEAPSDLGWRAALDCLENAGVDRRAVDLIVVACATPDQSQPAVACIIQEKLGLAEAHCPAFDVNSVCAGFVFALDVAQSMMLAEPARYRHVLVIGSDAFSKILNWDDRRTCVFFGDGAGAVLLAQVETSDRRIHFRLGCDGRGRRCIEVPAGGTRLPVTPEVLERRLNTFTMDGPRVWDFAVSTVPRTISALLAERELVPADLDLLVLHQSNLRMIRSDHEVAGAAHGADRDHGGDLRQHRRGQHPPHPEEGLVDQPAVAGRAGDAVRVRRGAVLGRGAGGVVSRRRPRNPDPGKGIMSRKRIAIACQGGGSQCAFVAGALRELFAQRVQDRYRIVGLSGTSGGALTAAVAWEGLLEEAAGHEVSVEDRLLAFWRDLTAQTPPEMMIDAIGVQLLRLQESGLLPSIARSPSSLQFRFLSGGGAAAGHPPGVHRPGRGDPQAHALRPAARAGQDRQPGAAGGAADVLEGTFKIFTSVRSEIKVESLLASAGIPNLFPAVWVDGHAYWDGIFSSNPPVTGFLQKIHMGRELLPEEIWIVQVNPPGRASIPEKPGDIFDRRNHMAGNLSLQHEIQVIQMINMLLQEEALTDRFRARFGLDTTQTIGLRYIRMSEALQESLDYPSKMSRQPGQIARLMADGEDRARAFLSELGHGARSRSPASAARSRPTDSMCTNAVRSATGLLLALIVTVPATTRAAPAGVPSQTPPGRRSTRPGQRRQPGGGGLAGAPLRQRLRPGVDAARLPQAVPAPAQARLAVQVRQHAERQRDLDRPPGPRAGRAAAPRHPADPGRLLLLRVRLRPPAGLQHPGLHLHRHALGHRGWLRRLPVPPGIQAAGRLLLPAQRPRHDRNLPVLSRHRSEHGPQLHAPGLHPGRLGRG
jgi:NTE family protein